MSILQSPEFYTLIGTIVFVVGLMVLDIRSKH
nr:MAG TPA: Poxvirus P21 membrane protein [Caudoviricetes sp.]